MQLSSLIKSILKILDIYTELDIPVAILDVLKVMDRLNIPIRYYTIDEAPKGFLMKVEIPLAADQPQDFSIPGMENFSFAFDIDPKENFFFIRLLIPYKKSGFIILKDLSFILKYTDISVVEENGNGLKIHLKGDLKINSALQVELLNFSSDCDQRFRFFDNDLHFYFQEFRFNFKKVADELPFMKLKNIPDQRGVYAKKVHVEIPIDSIFRLSQPFRFTFNELFITPSGVSFNFQKFFYAGIKDGNFDVASEQMFEVLGKNLLASFTSVKGKVENNRLDDFTFTGLIKIPLFEFFADIKFDLKKANSNDAVASVSISSLQAGKINFGASNITLGSFNLEGILSGKEVHLNGIVRELNINVSPLNISLLNVETSLFLSDEKDEFSFVMKDLAVPLLGTLAEAKCMASHIKTTDENKSSFSLQSKLQWKDISNRIQLIDFPAPADNDFIEINIEWKKDEVAKTEYVELVLNANVEDVSVYWNFIPENIRPLAKNGKLELKMHFKNADGFENATTSDSINIIASLAFDMKLPGSFQLPPNDLVAIHTGNEDGWVRASMALTANTREDNHHAEITIVDAVAIKINLPGLVQAEPPIFISLDSISFKTNQDVQAIANLEMKGTFRFLPLDLPVTIPFSNQVEQLLGVFATNGIAGDAFIKCKFSNQQSSCFIQCNFHDTTLEVDLFDLIARVSRGLTPPKEVQNGDEREVDLDIPFAFGLKGFSLQLGAFSQEADAEKMKFSVDFIFSIMDVEADVSLQLSDKAAKIGIKTLSIPLQFPKFPLTPKELNNLNSDKDWDKKINEINLDKTKHALLVAAFKIRSRITEKTAQANFENLLKTLVLILDGVSGIMHIESKVKLLIKDVGLNIPYNDPQAIALEGSAMLTGFVENDNLKCLEGIELGLGLSSDRIYFFAKSLGTPIPVNIGKYDVGSVSFTHFSIGYGFTKNSFSTAFSGKVNISQRLQEDADTSTKIGMGIRLPRNSALSFRLDLIPIPGPIPVVPYFEFNLDLQSPGLPAINNAEMCTPNWDGLQLIVPDVVRLAFKRAALSPFYGPIPAPNFSYSFDFSLGNQQNGLTVISDNFLILAGIGSPSTPITIPFIIDPASPYFDNLCVHANFAGFGMNFHLQRPFPQFNPLSIFEMLGLLSDPMMHVDPAGALANMLKVSLTETYITLPDYITYLAPSLKETKKKEVNIVLNLATVITAFQQVFKLLKQLQETIGKTDKGIRKKLAEIAIVLAKPEIGKVIQLIPPELKKFRAEVDLGGFQANMVFVIVDAGDKKSIKQAFANRKNKNIKAAPNTFKLLKLGDKANAEQAANFKPPLNLLPGQRVFDPFEDPGLLFKGIEFESFSDWDIDALPVQKKAMAGIIGGAYVRIFNQRYRFIGSVYEDGSFAMITSLKIDPLKFSVAGIEIKLGLEASGRMTLTGRRERNRNYASIALQGFSEWNMIPGVLSIHVGNKLKPVSLDVNSNGNFEINGDAQVSLFSGAASMDGKIEITNSHCFVNGNFNFSQVINNQNIIAIDLRGLARIGPGQKFDMAGVCTLKILDNTMFNASAEISNEKIMLEFFFKMSSWKMGLITIPFAEFIFKMKGELNYRDFATSGFYFEGAGKISVKNPLNTAQDQILLTIDGQVGIGYQQGLPKLKSVGKVDWFGMNWLGGGVEFGFDKIKISGATKINLNLTPDLVANQGSNVQLAHLAVHIDIDGFIELKSNGDFAVKLKGSWMMGVSDAGEQNYFPLASQKIQFPLNGNSLQIAKGGGIKLIDINSLDFLPIKKLFSIDFLDDIELYKSTFSWNVDPIKTPLDWPTIGIPPWAINLANVTIFNGKGGNMEIYSPLKINNAKKVKLGTVLNSITKIKVEFCCDDWRPYLRINDQDIEI